MEMYQQQAVQQGCTASFEPQMQMMMLQQEQKQMQIQFLKQQLMMLQPHLQNQSTTTTTSNISPIPAPAPLLSPQQLGQDEEYATTEDEEEDDDDDNESTDNEDHEDKDEEENDLKRPAQKVDPCHDNDIRPAKRQRENETEASLSVPLSATQRSMPEQDCPTNEDSVNKMPERANEPTVSQQRMNPLKDPSTPSPQSVTELHCHEQAHTSKMLSSEGPKKNDDCHNDKATK
jgi:hypothetical protein